MHNYAKTQPTETCDVCRSISNPYIYVLISPWCANFAFSKMGSFVKFWIHHGGQLGLHVVVAYIWTTSCEQFQNIGPIEHKFCLPSHPYYETMDGGVGGWVLHLFPPSMVHMTKWSGVNQKWNQQTNDHFGSFICFSKLSKNWNWWFSDWVFFSFLASFFALCHTYFWKNFGGFWFSTTVSTKDNV